MQEAEVTGFRDDGIGSEKSKHRCEQEEVLWSGSKSASTIIPPQTPREQKLSKGKSLAPGK